MKQALPGAARGDRPASPSKASRRCRSRGSATTTSRGRSGSPTAPCPASSARSWFEQRHMLHHTRRWNRRPLEELRSAWLNGVGVLVWENVFGAWVGWSERDRGDIARAWSRCSGGTLACSPTANGRRSPRRADDLQVVGSRWRLRRGRAVGAREPLLEAVRGRDRARRRPRTAHPSGRRARRRDRRPPGQGLRRWEHGVPGAPGRAARRSPACPSKKSLQGWSQAPRPAALVARSRRRETGLYGEAQ